MRHVVVRVRVRGEFSGEWLLIGGGLRLTEELLQEKARDDRGSGRRARCASTSRGLDRGFVPLGLRAPMTSIPTRSDGPSKRPTRARRSDAGAVRCSARDLKLLRIVGEHYAVTLPQLARTIGCSPHAARWLRSRWERPGWARGRALLVGESVFVWLTRQGKSLAGIDYSVWRPNAGMLAHIAAVTSVRLHILERHPGAT
jgi:hypothetical protein